MDTAIEVLKILVAAGIGGGLLALVRHLTASWRSVSTLKHEQRREERKDTIAEYRQIVTRLEKEMLADREAHARDEAEWYKWREQMNGDYLKLQRRYAHATARIESLQDALARNNVEYKPWVEPNGDHKPPQGDK